MFAEKEDVKRQMCTCRSCPFRLALGLKSFAANSTRDLSDLTWGGDLFVLQGNLRMDGRINGWVGGWREGGMSA